jgi:3-carboxy-cis,cis-muconate cycloisomerase
VLPELVLVTAGAARALADALATLRVYPERMQANLDATRGLALAEAVAMTLAGSMGKRDAHARVEEASRRAAAEGLSLAEALAADPEVGRHMTRDEIERRLDPALYLGEARTFVERVLARVSGAVNGS